MHRFTVGQSVWRNGIIIWIFGFENYFCNNVENQSKIDCNFFFILIYLLSWYSDCPNRHFAWLDLGWMTFLDFSMDLKHCLKY